MTTIISSQRYTNDEIVAAKREAQDYTVTLSPAFEVEGVEYQVILDGHHSLAAAKLDGAEPEYIEATKQTADTVALIERGEIEDFLVATRIDSDYYDIKTGSDVW